MSIKRNNNRKYKKYILFLSITWIVIILVSIVLIIKSLQKNDKEAFAIQEPSTIEETDEILIETTKETEQTTEETTQQSTEENLVGKAKSNLTGLFIDEEIANRRPFAVTINNLPKALPQSGISQADIYYEVLAEAGITRLVAVFQNSDYNKIGPVRSARHYFLDFALDNDAIYIHHGGSPQAYSSLQSLKINNFDGMKVSSFFFRDKTRMNQKGMYEHSSYIDATKFFPVLDKSGYRTERKDNVKPMFNFSDEDINLNNGQTAQKITLPYSNEQISVFEYDKENNVYNRFQNSKPHMDEITAEQLIVSNIIIQYTNVYLIAGDEQGRREVTLVGSGNGVYITAGKAIPIKWSKANHNSPTVWKDANGSELKLNKGKTWINVFATNGNVTIE